MLEFCQCFFCHHAVYEWLFTLCLVSKTGPEKKKLKKERIFNGYIMINGPFNAVCNLNHECTDIETVGWSNRNNLHWQVAQQFSDKVTLLSQPSKLSVLHSLPLKKKERRILLWDALSIRVFRLLVLDEGTVDLPDPSWPPWPSWAITWCVQGYLLSKVKSLSTFCWDCKNKC